MARVLPMVGDYVAGMNERRVECREHGWQPVVLYTRYDPKSRPRDVPDRYVCMMCCRDGAPANEGNSIRIGPDDRVLG